MLESMIQASEPTRAEVADVANAVIDGTSAVMLSAETSVGRYPVEAVRAMATIAEAAEEAPEIHGRARDIVQDTPAAAIMHAAVELAHEVDAAAIVIPTSTGGTPRACAKYRPRRPLIVLAHQPGVAEQLALEWGVYADADGPRRHRRRADRLRPRRRARLRRAGPGRQGRDHRGPRRDRRRHEPDHDPGGSRARSANPLLVRLLVFDDPQLKDRQEWLVDDADVHDAMRSLARQAYRRNKRDTPDEAGLPDLLRAHGTVDAVPYVPPARAA